MSYWDLLVVLEAQPHARELLLPPPGWLNVSTHILSARM